MCLGSPAPTPPFPKMRTLGAQCRVVAMTWVHHGVIVEAAEYLSFKIIHQRPELRRRVGLARPTRE